MATDPAISRDPNLDAVRESFGRVVYSHKTHEKAREIASYRVTFVKVTNIVLTTLTSATLISTLITSQRPLLYVSSVLSFLTLAFVLVQLSFDPAADAERHRATAKELWYVRERYINLLADYKASPASVDLPKRRDELIEALKKIYALAPNTSSGAYAAAQKALKVNEDLTFSDDEINAFLPDSLH